MKKVQKSRGDLLVDDLRKEDTFFNDGKQAWASCSIKENRHHMLVEGGRYGLRISKAYFDQCGRGIHPSELSSVIATLNALAMHHGEAKDTHLRVAGENEKFYFDLSNESNEMVEIDEVGYRVIPANDEIIFERYPNQTAQVYPVDSDQFELQKYLNFSESDLLLFCVYVVYLFVPNVQHPILVLYGEAGQGKSTISKMLKRIADPCHTESIMLERNKENLFLTMDTNWLVSFDNISKIPDVLSDDFCSFTTGIDYLKRKRYTDSDMYISKIKSCIVLNGIENVATREDLLSRSLLFEVCRKNIAKPAAELFHEFEDDLPKILGYIFRVLSEAMWIYPSVELTDNFRMAEFAKWGFAIAEAMDGKGKAFLAAYQANIEKQDAEAIDSNTLVLAIRQLMAESRNEWSGKPSDLLRELRRIGFEQGLNMRSNTMPESAPLLTKKLNAYKGLLRKIGIEYSHEGHKNNGARIVLKKL